MSIRIETIDCWVHRAPVATPVANAFGAMSNRPALWLRLTDSEGLTGWGEVFCNFPQVGAEHRARLIESLFVPLLRGAVATDPESTFAILEARTRRMAIQCGEPGPFAQIIGAIDQALWDLRARRAGVPLWRHLGGNPTVRAYASGIGPDDVGAVARERWDVGFRAFKLKLGFGRDRDLANLAEMRDAIGPDATLMCDANQAWEPEEARAMVRDIAVFHPIWIEEPIAADCPDAVWQQLAAESPVPIAAGENMRGLEAFRSAIAGRWLRYVQPDVGKWGGITRGLQIAAWAREHGVAYCPHWLAGGVGLAASLHALAGSGDPQGWAEIDANPNPLRESVMPIRLVEGRVHLGDRPGLGVEPDLKALAGWRV